MGVTLARVDMDWAGQLQDPREGPEKQGVEDRDWYRSGKCGGGNLREAGQEAFLGLSKGCALLLSRVRPRSGLGELQALGVGVEGPLCPLSNGLGTCSELLSLFLLLHPTFHPPPASHRVGER